MAIKRAPNVAEPKPSLEAGQNTISTVKRIPFAQALARESNTQRSELFTGQLNGHRSRGRRRKQ